MHVLKLPAVMLLVVACAPLMAAQPRPVDTLAVSRALNDILETAKTGSRTRWQGEHGHFGFITVKRTWFPETNTPCREYRRTLNTPGKGGATVIHGSGCRDDNGNWLLLESVGEVADCKPTPATTPKARSTRRKKPPTTVRRKAPAKTPTKAPKVVATPLKPPAAIPAAKPRPKPKPVNPAASAVDDASQPTAADW